MSKKVLKKFAYLLEEGLELHPDFVRDRHGFIVGLSLTIISGEHQIALPPQMLPWPLEPVVMPNAPREKLN